MRTLGQDIHLEHPAGILIVEQLPQPGDHYLILCTPSRRVATHFAMEATIPPR
jgi:hypothetical protein